MSGLLLHGGNVLTHDPARPSAQALLLRDGTIAAVGSDDEVAAVAGAAARVDLDGRTVCPGFIDAHNHFVFGVVAELGIDCRSPRIGSLAHLLDTLGSVVAHTPAGRWIRGWGYNELHLGRHPSLAELDLVAPDHPLVVAHESGHMCVANSAALRAAAITESTPDPRNGIIGRRRGRLTGLLQEQAAEVVDVRARNAIVAADPAASVAAAHAVATRFSGLGITTICDPCVPAEVEPLYAELAADPAFPVGLVGLGMGAAGMFVPPAERLAHLGADRSFAISGIKLFADGGEQCAVCVTRGQAVRTALHTVRAAFRHRTLTGLRLVRAPVMRRSDDGRVRTGMRFLGDEELATLLARTATAGGIGAVHAMGNEAIDQVISAVDQARRHAPDDAVFRMEHAMMAAESSFPALARASMTAVVQPRFVHEFGFPLLLTGTNRVLRTLAFRDLLDAGVALAGSSDAPVCEPAVLPAIESAVTRLTKEGERLDRDQALTVDEALALYTTGAARAVGLEASHGVLAPGRAADVVVLSDDPRSVAPTRIGTITVEATYRAGRCVASGARWA